MEDFTYRLRGDSNSRLDLAPLANEESKKKHKQSCAKGKKNRKRKDKISHGKKRRYSKN